MPAYTNAKTTVPKLFKEIMKNHAAIDRLRTASVVPFAEASRLLQERADFRRAAEKALRWNTDKGTAV